MSALEVEPMDHADMWDLCSYLTRIIYATEAKSLLTSGELPRRASLVALPVWAARVPKVDVGRKGRGGDYFPVRVDWGRPPLMVVEAANVTLPWSINSLGVKESGVATTSSPPKLELSGVASINMNIAAAPPQYKSGLVGQLEAIAADGHAARWDLLQVIDQVTEKALNRAHMGLMQEYSEARYGHPGISNTPLLHTEALEALRTRLVFGDGDEAVDDIVMVRTIADMQAVTAFTKVDPQRWLKVRVGRLARYWIRREAGDPEAGPQIRRAARELGTDDPNLIASVLPGMGRKRIEAALGLAPHPEVRSFRFGYEDPSGTYGWDDSAIEARVISRV